MNDPCRVYFELCVLSDLPSDEQELNRIVGKKATSFKQVADISPAGRVYDYSAWTLSSRHRRATEIKGLLNTFFSRIRNTDKIRKGLSSLPVEVRLEIVVVSLVKFCPSLSLPRELIAKIYSLNAVVEYDLCLNRILPLKKSKIIKTKKVNGTIEAITTLYDPDRIRISLVIISSQKLNEKRLNHLIGKKATSFKQVGDLSPDGDVYKESSWELASRPRREFETEFLIDELFSRINDVETIRKELSSLPIRVKLNIIADDITASCPSIIFRPDQIEKIHLLNADVDIDVRL